MLQKKYQEKIPEKIILLKNDKNYGLNIVANFKAIEPFTFDNRMKGFNACHALSHGKAFFE